MAGIRRSGIKASCEKCKNEAKFYVEAPHVHDEDTAIYLQRLAGFVDGTSKFYVVPPGDKSTIGKCLICGGQLKAEPFFEE